MNRRLLLVRHGVTDWNREGRFQGHRDPPLAADGRSEAGFLAARLAAETPLRPRRIVTSPLSRAAETARVIAGATEAPAPVLDARLMEIGQGEWEGRTHAELAVEDAARYAAWRASPSTAPPPGAEPIAAALERVADALAQVAGGDGWPVCLVSHGGTLRLAVRHLLQLSGPRAWAVDLDNASLSSLLLMDDGAWRIERWNDTGHLLGRTPQHVDEAEGEPLAL